MLSQARMTNFTPCVVRNIPSTLSRNRLINTDHRTRIFSIFSLSLSAFGSSLLKHSHQHKNHAKTMGQCLIEVWIVDGRRVAILRDGLLLELQLQFGLITCGVRGVGQVDKLLAARSALLWRTKLEREVIEGLGVVEVEVVNVVSK